METSARISRWGQIPHHTWRSWTPLRLKCLVGDVKREGEPGV